MYGVLRTRCTDELPSSQGGAFLSGWREVPNDVALAIPDFSLFFFSFRLWLVLRSYRNKKRSLPVASGFKV